MGRSAARGLPAPVVVDVGPQPGPQAAVLASPADILVAGGSAGGGKTRALMLEPIRHLRKPTFGAVLFRREITRITQEGGMWDESFGLYPPLRGIPRTVPARQWRFPSGAKITFAHLQHESDKLNKAGGQIALQAFDQLEEFTEGQFWYLWGRARSTSGVRPYVRASANPIPATDPLGGWVHRLLQWWIDPVTGLAIPERSGVLRWFVRDVDALVWGDRAELAAHYGRPPISLTFIRMTLADNPALRRKDPDYEAKLHALPRVERERLLGGNWNVTEAAGLVFDRTWFDVLRAWPADANGHPVGVSARIRYWDKAATEGGGKYSAGVRMARTTDGVFLVEDVVRGQWSPDNRERAIVQCAMLDPPGTVVWVEQEPGSGGKESAGLTIRRLAGYEVHADRVTGDKLTRAGPLRSQAEARAVKCLAGAWNEEFLRECHNWSGRSDEVCDQIDAAAGAFVKLALRTREAGMLHIVGL
jgi:predicted phage terminase large subunit-like protein